MFEVSHLVRNQHVEVNHFVRNQQVGGKSFYPESEGMK